MFPHRTSYAENWARITIQTLCNVTTFKMRRSSEHNERFTFSFWMWRRTRKENVRLGTYIHPHGEAQTLNWRNRRKKTHFWREQNEWRAQLLLHMSKFKDLYFEGSKLVPVTVPASCEHICCVHYICWQMFFFVCFFSSWSTDALVSKCCSYSSDSFPTYTPIY